MKTLAKITLAALLGASAWSAADACSRVVYLGTTDEKIVLVGRTLDWRTPIPTNLYVYPRGVEKESMPDGNRYTWKSKYGSVVAVGYDGGVTEGMNEAGLIMNGLFCKTAVYITADPQSKTPVMSNAVLISYFLDNFATVDEAEAWLKANPLAINTKAFDGGTVSLLHWAITDRSGETLLIEYVDGVQHLYKGRDLTALTNDPEHPKMMAIEDYWKGIGGVNMLPGTVKSADRFVRASFFINHVPKDFAYPQAWGSLSSIMGTVTVPYGYEIEGEPNVSSTQWRSIADASGKYYFKFADQTADMWIDLGRLRLNPGAPILKLDTSEHLNLAGDVNGHLRKTEGFTPMW